MRKGKYIIYGLLIWAVAWFFGGFSVYRFVYCVNRSYLTHYFFEMFAWIACFLIAGVGGTILGWMQMKAPADPKVINLNTDLSSIREKQVETIIALLKTDAENLNKARLTIIKEKQKDKYYLTCSDLIYHYWINGKKTTGRCNSVGYVYLLKPEDIYLVPTSFSTQISAKSDKTKIWEGFCDSQSQRYKLKDFSIFISEEERTTILYLGVINNLKDTDKLIDSLPHQLVEKIKTMSDAECKTTLDEYLKEKKIEI